MCTCPTQSRSNYSGAASTCSPRLKTDAAELPDDDLLGRCAGLGRILVTFDIGFKAMAEAWPRSGREFGGLIYAHPLRVSIGQLVNDLELIAKATDRSEWFNAIEHLPL